MIGRGLFAQIDLIENAAVGEVGFLRLGPATELSVNGDQFKFGKYVGVFGRDRLVAWAVEIPSRDVLALVGIKILKVGFRHRFGTLLLDDLVDDRNRWLRKDAQRRNNDFVFVGAKFLQPFARQVGLATISQTSGKLLTG